MEITTIHFANELAEQLKPFAPSLAQRKMQKLKLIIHAGTPKTGTTSLQTYLNKKQRKLRGKGILYPHNLEQSANPTAPRHQWWDFPDESKDVLCALNELFNVEVWVWFREPLGFIESFYKQCIRNPQVQSNPCYGKDLSFAEMLNIQWFSQHLNYQDFVSECQTLFGEESVLAFKYEGDVVQEVIHKLGLSTPHDNPTPRQNNSLNSASIKLLRTINHYNVKAKDKELLIPHLKEMNGILEHYVNDTLIDNESRKKVLELSNAMNLYTAFR